MATDESDAETVSNGAPMSSVEVQLLDEDLRKLVEAAVRFNCDPGSFSDEEYKDLKVRADRAASIVKKRDLPGLDRENVLAALQHWPWDGLSEHIAYLRLATQTIELWSEQAATDTASTRDDCRGKMLGRSPGEKVARRQVPCPLNPRLRTMQPRPQQNVLFREQLSAPHIRGRND